MTEEKVARLNKLKEALKNRRRLFPFETDWLVQELDQAWARERICDSVEKEHSFANDKQWHRGATERLDKKI